ncbi:VOC family protein [Caulobacter sp. Root655]|uniref:VOC family protein n=1 Tax=Caulobacter sp. Root655 TaxID=1736578 RepID=UPI000AF03497|nr:VOC family protein [Caulobacter sp. Root655]
MLDHLEIRTRRLADCVGFYRQVLEPAGYSLVVDGPKKGFGSGGRLDFWIVEGDPSADVHYAFVTDDRAAVDRAYAMAGDHGGVQERAPAVLPQIHPYYYAGFAHDPDGRLVEFVSHTEA